MLRINNQNQNENLTPAQKRLNLCLDYQDIVNRYNHIANEQDQNEITNLLSNATNNCIGMNELGLTDLNFGNNEDIKNATLEYLERTIVDKRDFPTNQMLADLNTVSGTDYSRQYSSKKDSRYRNIIGNGGRYFNNIDPENTNMPRIAIHNNEINLNQQQVFTPNRFNQTLLNSIAQNSGTIHQTNQLNASHQQGRNQITANFNINNNQLPPNSQDRNSLNNYTVINRNNNNSNNNHNLVRNDAQHNSQQDIGRSNALHRPH